jgi:Flp pilus assembly protein TadD
MMNRILRGHGAWIAVALAAIAVHANSLANGYALDDVFIIQMNGRVHQLADQSRIWLNPYWPSFGTELGLYRPFAIFAYALQWAAGGGAAWFFHAMSVALHATTSVLAFLLLRTLVGPGLPALLGGLLFAVHPVRTEAVANIVGQAELIAGAATFGACLLYATRPAGASTGWGRRCALVLLYALAILTKESAIVLPGLLVALDFAQRRATVTRAGLIAYARATALPLFLLAATATAYLTLRVDVLGSIGGVDAAPSLPFLREAARVPTALRAWPEYVRLLFLPADLVADYSPGVILPVEGISPMALLGAALLALTVILALLTPVLPAAGLPAAWFFISVLPVSNLLLPIGVVVAERLLYTPAFAVSLIVAYAWPALMARARDAHPRRLAHAAAALVLGLLGVRTVVRNPDWKDTPAVWNAIVRDHPESYRSQWITSSHVYSSGQTQRGLAFLELANRMWPNDSQLLDDLAYHYIGRADYERALVLLERSRRYVPWVHRTELLLAQAAIGARQYQRALDAINRADRLGADHSITFPLYAQAYDGLGRTGAAVGAWRATVRLPLGRLWAYWARHARALAIHGDDAAAMAASDSARALAGSDSTALHTVAVLADAIGRGCYPIAPDSPEHSACTDPLADWDVLVPQTVLFAGNSQNARSGGSEGGAAQVAGGS